MEKNVIYPNPTLKQVIFQIRFPNLFYIETKIPEFQLAILDEFPESELIIQQAIPIGIMGQQDAQSPLPIKKVWQFSNNSGYILKLSTDSLSIDSSTHKSYDNSSQGTCFREIIEYCLHGFIRVINLPFVSRVGLRYIDQVPFFDQENVEYSECFDSGLNIEKLNIEDLDEMTIRVVKKLDDGFKFIYQESFNLLADKSNVFLDFDAFTERTSFSEILTVTDKLHEIVSTEFFKTIKQPIIELMSK